jgi:RNA recognition motif-containing protein
MIVDDTSSQMSSQDINNKPENLLNNTNKTVIIKNLSLSINEDDLQSFIKTQVNYPIEDIRIVRDKKGNSKGFAFADFSTTEDASNCAKILNNQKLLDQNLSCAVSKPPALGENDKRTIFINNLPFDATDETVRSTFEKVNKIIFT